MSRWARISFGICLLFTVGAAPLAAQDTARPPGGVGVDVNQPRTQFECDTPIGINWYGSTQRCLEELCGGKNVTNEWLFDQFGRARKNPCYGFNPFQFEQK